MANRQTTSSSSHKTPSTKTGRARTGERDENYDVISVLYHALQGADTIARYIEDAREIKDQELLAFFEETRSEYAARAAEAKQLLAGRLAGTTNGAGSDEEGEDDED